jgi:hypothetical protein
MNKKDKNIIEKIGATVILSMMIVMMIYLMIRYDFIEGWMYGIIVCTFFSFTILLIWKNKLI